MTAILLGGGAWLAIATLVGIAVGKFIKSRTGGGRRD